MSAEADRWTIVGTPGTLATSSTIPPMPIAPRPIDYSREPVPRAEFASLKADLATVAHIVERMTKFGAKSGIAPFGGKASDDLEAALTRIASEGK